MGTRRDQGILKKLHILAGILAVGAGFPVVASATQEQLPAAYTSLSSINLNEQNTATELTSALLSEPTTTPEARVPLYVRYRNFKVLNYSRALVVGKEDVIVRVQSPGKRKSLMMVELKF